MADFNVIAQQNNTPGTRIEISNDRAFAFAQDNPALLIGQVLPGADVTVDESITISSTANARSQFGSGSVLALMAEQYFKARTRPINCLPIADDSSAVAAIKTITLAGDAGDRSSAAIYIGGKRIQFAVARNASASDVASEMQIAIAADQNLPMVATVSASVLTLTAKNKGLTGEDIDVRLNFYGADNGEGFSGNLTANIETATAGAGNPSIADALANIAAQRYEIIVSAFNDVANIDIIRDACDDSITGRWGPAEMLYGHVIYGKSASYAGCVSYGLTRNDQHASCVGVHGNLEPSWLWATAVAAAVNNAIDADPARPFQTLELKGITAPAILNRFTAGEREQLLSSGIATWKVADDGRVLIERVVTTYRENEAGDADRSYLDANTMFTLSLYARYTKSRWDQAFPRHKLAKDNTALRPGAKIMTPKIARQFLIGTYQELMDLGLVESIESFKNELIVEVSDQDPNRLNIVLVPDLINQLRVTAIRVDFVLNN